MKARHPHQTWSLSTVPESMELWHQLCLPTEGCQRHHPGVQQSHSVTDEQHLLLGFVHANMCPLVMQRASNTVTGIRAVTCRWMALLKEQGARTYQCRTAWSSKWKWMLAVPLPMKVSREYTSRLDYLLFGEGQRYKLMGKTSQKHSVMLAWSNHIRLSNSPGK